MKEILEFAGAVLYLVFRILTFPLLVVTQCLLELWAALNYVGANQKRWRVALKKRRRVSHPMPGRITVALARIRSMLW